MVKTNKVLSSDSIKFNNIDKKRSKNNNNNNNNNNSSFILGNNVQLKSTQNNKNKTFTQMNILNHPIYDLSLKP